MKNLLVVLFLFFSILVNAQSYRTYDIEKYSWYSPTEKYVKNGRQIMESTFKEKEGDWLNWSFGDISTNYKIVNKFVEGDHVVYLCLGKNNTRFNFYVYDDQVFMFHRDDSDGTNDMFVFNRYSIL